MKSTLGATATGPTGRTGHRKERAFGGDAVRAVHRDADAAAHHHAVEQRHGRLVERRDREVGAVLVAEKRARQRVLAPPAVRVWPAAQRQLSGVVDADHVAAGAERARAGAAQQHSGARRIAHKAAVQLAQRLYHGLIERIERLFAVRSGR